VSRGAFLLGTCLLATSASIGFAQPPERSLVYGGDQSFPPYEYLDESGKPDGFNVHLIRAMAREAGMSIEIRLGQRDERMREFDSGLTDVMFLSYTEERAARYQLLDQTWTLAQVVMMRPGLPRYPRGLDDLWGVRIAVDEGSVNHVLLAALPESRRPALKVVKTRADVIAALERGEVDGVAGNHLTMRFMMGALGDNAVEVPLISRPYHLAVLPGRDNVVAPLRVGLDRLKASGEFDRLVEQYLTNPVRRTWLERYAVSLIAGGTMLLLLFAGGTAWNRALRRQVKARTKAVERTERRYRDLVDNASDMIYRTDPFGRFTFVNPVATRILCYDEGELLSMKYFELIRPDWVPRAMDFYEKAAKGRDSTYLEFPVRTKDGREIWVGQHVRPIATGGRIEGFQGMAREITDLVNAQSELRTARDLGTAILDTTPNLIIVLDAHGYIVRFNRACEVLSGLSMSDVAGQPIWQLPCLLDDDGIEIRDCVARLAASTEPVSVVRTWKGKDGARHVITWKIVTLRGQSDATSHLIGIGSDVTSARELEQVTAKAPR
jgi:PAS domain S-box-containing protein